VSGARPLRVLVAPEWYPWADQPYFGTFCREQARAVARVADVAVLTWRADASLRTPFRVERDVEDGLWTSRVRFARSRVPKAGFGFKLAGCLEALAHLARSGFVADVVHAHEYDAGRLAHALGSLTRAPVVMSEHWSGLAVGALPAEERRRAKRAFERAAVVCPVSHDLASHLRTLAPHATIEPVPNVVDTDAFAFADRSGRRGPARLVTVGSLVEIKGHRHLVRAIGALRRAGVDLTLDVIGDGPLRGELERLAGDAGVADVVRFRGAIPKTEVAAALAGSDVFVLPSLWENLPCALIEAMATGLPVVATRVGGVPEVVGTTGGRLVAPGSPDALAAGIAAAVADRTRHDARAVRDAVVARFGYAAVAERWLQIYERARSKARGAATGAASP
jgi:glycosyltransferase involved in cell wall biosynthesis